MPQKTHLSKLVKFISRPKFFWGVIALLVLQAAWIALSGRYPMAFDEDFHLGIISLYADHVSPFWGGQPAGADAFGALARDPSYLYHWLMSFPYRFIGLFTNSLMIQVLFLRALNIALFAYGVVLFRRLLTKTGISGAIINLSALAFVLIPIVPLLAAQINYDNLIMPVLAGVLLLTARFDSLLAKKGRFDVKSLLWLLIICMLASLVKYAFLPFAAAIAGFIIVRVLMKERSPRHILASLTAGWRRISRWCQLGLVLLAIITGGLFVERYGVNLARYHAPTADCEQVLTIEQCSHYGPWIRDHNYAANKLDRPSDPITFTRHWFYGMWLRTFFAVDGPSTGFQTRVPLLVPGWSAMVFGALSAIAVILAAPRLLRRYNAPLLWLLSSVTALYVGILWVEEYQAFLKTGQPVAINGRYLLLVLLPVLAIAGAAINELLRGRTAAKALVAASVIICLAWGGGAMTYVLRSNTAWYWPNSALESSNQALQRVFGPITPGYGNGIKFRP